MKKIPAILLLTLIGCEGAPQRPAEKTPAVADSIAVSPAPAAPSPLATAPTPAQPPAEAPLVAPFDLEFIRKARWAGGHEGFDAKLPGYHLAGDIARIKLIPKPLAPNAPGGLRQHPKSIVLTIQTSPGMPPNVENLTITAGGVTLSTALSNGSDGKDKIEIRKLAEGPRGETKRVPQSDYLELKPVGGAVHLRLLPAAMELLKDGGELSWIDWYRG